MLASGETADQLLRAHNLVEIWGCCLAFIFTLTIVGPSYEACPNEGEHGVFCDAHVRANDTIFSECTCGYSIDNMKYFLWQCTQCNNVNFTAEQR